MIAGNMNVQASVNTGGPRASSMDVTSHQRDAVLRAV